MRKICVIDLTKLSVTMWYTFFGIFDDTSLWILPKTHDLSLCDTPDDNIAVFFILFYIFLNRDALVSEAADTDHTHYLSREVEK